MTETTPITEQFGARLEHQVHDRHATRMALSGPTITICGATIVPAPMATPEGKPCPACTSTLRRAQGTPRPNRNRNRRTLANRWWGLAP
jgi:hypothetical protein